MNKLYDFAVLFRGVHPKNTLLCLQNTICIRLLIEAIVQHQIEKILETTQLTRDKDWLDKLPNRTQHNSLKLLKNEDAVCQQT